MQRKRKGGKERRSQRGKEGWGEGGRDEEREGGMLNRSAWQQLYSQPFSQIYGRAQAPQRSSLSETKEMDQADPPSSATPSVPIHPPRYCDPINRPSRARGLGQGQDCSLSRSPSLASPLPGCTFPPLWSLSGLCQSNEQSLNSSTARKQMEPRENLQHIQKESEGGKRAVW